jgi:uncharacterized membrane protein YkoI
MNRIARTTLPLTLASAVLLGVTGCGGDGDSTSASSPSTTSSISTSASSPAGTTSSRPAASTTSTVAASSDANGAAVSQQQAEQIALTTAGAGSAVVKTEADDEDGRAVWKVDVTVNGQKRKIEVDQTTGGVVKNEAGD